MNKTFIKSENPGLFSIIINEFLNQKTYILVLRFTLLLLLFYGSSSIILDVPLRIVCSLMLLLPILQNNQIMWVIICALVWLINATDWFALDNHKILIGYWCLVCALAVSSQAVSSEKIEKVLAFNGKMLIGLTFLFATFWKIFSGEYWDGSFLHYTFLSDRRVEFLASFVGNISPDILLQNRLLENLLRYLPQQIGSITVNSTPQLQLFTLAASYWTLFIEGAVAFAFLCGKPYPPLNTPPLKGGEEKRESQEKVFPPLNKGGLGGVNFTLGKALLKIFELRHWILMLFIATTYFLLPVLGFAYILMIMGFAQCLPENNKIKIAYICLFGLLQFARFPWTILLIYL